MLECRDLSKRFGHTLVVDSISLSVARGELYGLLGPNGAGKTTTISLIAGLLDPDDGSISIGGTSVGLDRRHAMRKLGARALRSVVERRPAHLRSSNVYFGDGEPIPNDLVDEVREVTDGERCVHSWRPGDLLIVDNMLTAHGRMPFEGTRLVIVVMIGDWSDPVLGSVIEPESSEGP